jgi:hypothetical protein
MDGQTWIDPYLAQPVALPGGSATRVAVARDHLTASGAWKDQLPLPLPELLVARWQVDLARLVPIEPRLRIFAKDGGGWLNPWTGALVPDVHRIDGRVTVATLAAMARHLTACPEARGPLLDQATLISRGQALGVIGQGRVADPPTTQVVHHADMAEDLAKARSVQQRQFAELPTVPGLAIAAHASAHQGVSGDFYLVAPWSDGSWLIALGDVTGHGMQAALVVSAAMKTMRMLLRDIAPAGDDRLNRLLARFNDEVRSDLVPGQFLTLTVALIDPSQSTCTVVLCGHHPALLVAPDGQILIQRVGRQGMAVGIASSAAFVRTLHPVTCPLGPGDLLVQYSDGLSEAADAAGGQFGDHGVAGTLLSRAHLPLQEIVDGVVHDARRHAGGAPGDDLTLIAVSRSGDATTA